jgi:hypothetical protein
VSQWSVTSAERRSYGRREVKFEYGAAFDKFKTGLYFPKLATHKGFDLLLIDDLVEKGNNTKFFTAVECRFSKKKQNGDPSS